MDDANQAQVIDGYAKALLAIASAEGDSDGITGELQRISQAFTRSDELREALIDARIPMDRKLGVVSDLLGSRASETTVSMVDMLVSTGRIRDFADIAARMGELAAASEGQVVAEVTSAIELDDATVARLADKLAAATGKPVTVRNIVDPAVMGGIVARVGDTVFDGSVRSRFRDLREAWG